VRLPTEAAARIHPSRPQARRDRARRSPPSKVPQLPASRVGSMAQAAPGSAAAAEGDRTWPRRVRSGHLTPSSRRRVPVVG